MGPSELMSTNAVVHSEYIMFHSSGITFTYCIFNTVVSFSVLKKSTFFFSGPTSMIGIPAMKNLLI